MCLVCLPFGVAAGTLGSGESGSASAFPVPYDAEADCTHEGEDTTYDDANLVSEGETPFSGIVARARARGRSCDVDNLGGED